MEHPDNDAQDIIDAVWGNEDQRMAMLARLRINGGVYGHCFVKLVMPKNKKPASVDNPPRLVVQNPELYHVDADPDDCELAQRYSCIWPSTDDHGNTCQRMQTTTRVDPDGWDNSIATGVDEDTHWEIQDWQRANDGQEWQPIGPVMMWPYPYAPIVDWQNFPEPNDHWGARDVDDSVVNLNRNLHLVESNTNAVLYSHGHPWLFSNGADTTGITPTPGVITDLGSPDAKITAISASGEPAAMMNFAAEIRANMDEATSMPGVATGRMTDLPRGQISGITLHLLYGPRIMRTEHERRLYGQGIRDICRLILLVCGQDASAKEDVQLTWQDALPTDDLAMAQMALALQQLGLSKHTIYSLIGQNYDVEQQYIEQEADDAAKTAAKGIGNPPVPAGFPSLAQPGAAPANPASEPGQAPPQAAMPAAVVNSPAAVKQRAAMKAASAMVKSGKLNG